MISQFAFLRFSFVIASVRPHLLTFAPTDAGGWNQGSGAAANGFDAANDDGGFTSQDARGDVSDSACRNCGQGK